MLAVGVTAISVAQCTPFMQFVTAISVLSKHETSSLEGMILGAIQHRIRRARALGTLVERICFDSRALGNGGFCVRRGGNRK